MSEDYPPIIVDLTGPDWQGAPRFYAQRNDDKGEIAVGETEREARET